MAATNALSTYNLSNSRLDRSHHRDLRHVACAVYVRMARYYDTHRKTGIVASLFGEETAMPYTMFASAVFFAPDAPRGSRDSMAIGTIHANLASVAKTAFGNVCVSMVVGKRAKSSVK